MVPGFRVEHDDWCARCKGGPQPILVLPDLDPSQSDLDTRACLACWTITLGEAIVRYPPPLQHPRKARPACAVCHDYEEGTDCRGEYDDCPGAR